MATNSMWRFTAQTPARRSCSLTDGASTAPRGIMPRSASLIASGSYSGILPGVGQSSQPGDRDYSTERFAQDLRAVLELTGDRKALLLGHSIGGMTIQTFCRLFPDVVASRVAGIVLANTTHTDPTRTTIASGLVQALEKPVLVPLLYLTVWLWPVVWVMNVLSYL